MTKNVDNLMEQLPQSPVHEWDSEPFQRIWSFEEINNGKCLEKLSKFKKMDKNDIFLDKVNGKTFFDFPLDNYNVFTKRKIQKCFFFLAYLI